MAREIRTCTVCGVKFSATVNSGVCPVCMLRRAAEEGIESDESLSEQTVAPSLEQVALRFEHYELALDEEGRPLELGRGAMGVTYKAVDINLHCPVTLKVISEKYLDDEAARVRFLREARAAASVRHPNVASVFHLGRKGRDYFYAMEFVEGDTLDSLIKRSGALEVRCALEIAMQVGASLSFAQKLDPGAPPKSCPLRIFQTDEAAEIKALRLQLQQRADWAVYTNPTRTIRRSTAGSNGILDTSTTISEGSLKGLA